MGSLPRPRMTNKRCEQRQHHREWGDLRAAGIFSYSHGDHSGVSIENTAAVAANTNGVVFGIAACSGRSYSPISIVNSGTFGQ